MSFNWTQISPSSGSFTFLSRSSSTFQFRFGDTDNYAPYNPESYLSKVPPYRGNSKPTIGGNRVEQLFGQYVCDGEITFEAMLTEAEVADFENAKAAGITWQLKGYIGGTYIVTFDMTDGFQVHSKIKANDKFICGFKFKKESKV